MMPLMRERFVEPTRLPTAWFLGRVGLGMRLRRVVTVIAGGILAGADLSALAALARASARLGFSYPQLAVLIMLVAIAWYFEGTGVRARW
jgi:hypothetical protein